MKKKSIIILCSVAVVCAIGLVTSRFVDWPVNSNDTSGDIAKAARFSREQASEKLSNMEELLKTDSAFKDGIVAAQVVMQTRAAQFGTLVDLSNEVAGNIPAFAEVLKEMNANREVVNNVTNSLVESADNLNAALGGEECPDLAQTTINASLAYNTAIGNINRAPLNQAQNFSLNQTIGNVISQTAAVANSEIIAAKFDRVPPNI